MADEDHTKHEAYLEGRLQGLNQLVSILRDAIEDNPAAESAEIVRSIVTHISSEMQSILVAMKEMHGEHPVLTEAAKETKKMVKEAEKVEREELPAAPALRKQVVASEELMKRLLELQKQAAGAKGAEKDEEE
jgi:hypothetical protein